MNLHEKPGSESLPTQFLNAGESVTIGEKKYEITKVASAVDVGKELGVRIARRIPVYYLNGVSAKSRGAYHPETDCVLAFTNTDNETLRHELTHAVEYLQEKTPELLDVYRRAKERITEDSFEGGFVSFNFMKDIHEFIADGTTKPAVIAALKKEGLYDDFIRASAYLFDDAAPE